MSPFTEMTKHPETGEVKPANWFNDYFGMNKPGVVFIDDRIRAFKGRDCERVQTVGIPASLYQIGELIRTQDNRATDAPIFVVQQKKRIWGLDDNYASDYAWLFEDNEADPSEAQLLDRLVEEGKETPDGWRQVGYVDQWEFVTACFTEKGCEDYIAMNAHNLNEPRIYAAGSYRNEEFRLVREFLKGLK